MAIRTVYNWHPAVISESATESADSPLQTNLPGQRCEVMTKSCQLITRGPFLCHQSAHGGNLHERWVWRHAEKVIGQNQTHKITYPWHACQLADP